MKSPIHQYLQIGITAILALVSFIFTTTTFGLKADVEKIRDGDDTIGKEVSALKADNITMKEWLSRVEIKIDKAIAK